MREIAGGVLLVTASASFGAVDNGKRFHSTGCPAGAPCQLGTKIISFENVRKGDGGPGERVVPGRRPSGAPRMTGSAPTALDVQLGPLIKRGQ